MPKYAFIRKSVDITDGVVCSTYNGVHTVIADDPINVDTEILNEKELDDLLKTCLILDVNIKQMEVNDVYNSEHYIGQGHWLNYWIIKLTDEDYIQPEGSVTTEQFNSCRE